MIARLAFVFGLMGCTMASAIVPAEALSGGATTSFDTGRNAFSHSLANITTVTRRHHAVGNSLFSENWVAAPASATSRDGLGPMFNARSCSGCHFLDGRGAPPEPDKDSAALLVRISIMENGRAVPDPVYGGQIQPRSLPGGAPEAQVSVRWSEHEETYPDGKEITLRKPVLEFSAWADGPPSHPLLTSPRIANAVHGLGLLEAVPEAAIRSLADPEDADKDGISGRANEAWDKTLQKRMLGRFGWKASQPSVRQQTAEAFLGDMGITSPVNPQEAFTPAQKARLASLPSGGEPEIPENLLQHVTTYMRTLAPPARRDVDDPVVRRGSVLFNDLKCARCHVPLMVTGEVSDITELSNQIIRPYTDLLLHDMGEGLADGRPDEDATGVEWRTPPLWGMGLQKAVNGHTTFLHDGRARNAEEAILWHGGEAAASRDAFMRLPQSDRADLLRFLDSL